MELSLVTEKYILGTLPSEHLPNAAADALEAGLDSPSLRRLAGAQGADNEDIRKLFYSALDELHISVPLPSEAALSWARRIARDIVEGAISPYEGARQIWWKIYTRFPQLRELTPFVGLASEYEDHMADRNYYSQDIIEESKKFLTRCP